MLYLRSLAHDPFGDGANGNRNRKVGIQYPSWAVRPSPRRQISRGHWSTAASVVGSNNSPLAGLGLICLKTWRHFSRRARLIRHPARVPGRVPDHADIDLSHSRHGRNCILRHHRQFLRRRAIGRGQRHVDPTHLDAVALESLIRDCWAKVELGYDRILVRDGADAGWINYMLKDRQKSEFDGCVDCIMIESLHNPIADA